MHARLGQEKGSACAFLKQPGQPETPLRSWAFWNPGLSHESHASSAFPFAGLVIRGLDGLRFLPCSQQWLFIGH